MALTRSCGRRAFVNAMIGIEAVSGAASSCVASFDPSIR